MSDECQRSLDFEPFHLHLLSLYTLSTRLLLFTSLPLHQAVSYLREPLVSAFRFFSLSLLLILVSGRRWAVLPFSVPLSPFLFSLQTLAFLSHLNS